MNLTIALLGVQHYHANFWASAFRQSEGVELTGFFEPDDRLASDFSAAHEVKRWQDGDRLAAACDAVAICSATVDHPALVELAARHRRPVLCEKPLGATTADCARIAEIVARSSIGFMQSFPKRFDPVNHEIADILRKEAIGRLTMCRVRHGHSHGLTAEFHKAWFVDRARSGGGTLLDEGIHAADFLRFLFGEPRDVTATISSRALGLPVEDTAMAIFRYDDGMVAEVATSWCFVGADTSIEIYGTEGTILLSGVDIASRPAREKDFLRVFCKEGPQGSWSSSPTVPHFKTGIFHEHVAWAFVKALKESTAFPVTLADGHRAFAMIEAAYRSAESGRVEAIVYPHGA